MITIMMNTIQKYGQWIKHYKYLKNDIQHNYRYMSTSNNSDDDTSSDDTSNKKINLKDNDDLIVENMY